MEGPDSLVILKETSDYLVIDKPAGWIVERSPFEAQSVEATVFSYLAQKKKTPFVGIVHRLDKVTSGVMILAKKKSALKALNQQFATRQIKKEYWAIVEGCPISMKVRWCIGWRKTKKINGRLCMTPKKKETTFMSFDV
ncbi:MAG: RNA pseudouridine synthase [Saprospiraceae bacterium]|nr:RNA pseudouridine synthase [Saprospiraceae bacterium]